MKQKVLIIYASTGSGHKTAAESIFTVCENVSDVKIVDLLDYGIVKFNGNRAANSYTGIAAPLHDITWRFNFTGRINWGGNSIFGSLLFRKFKSFIEEFNPDVVICTHMMAANVVAGARIKTGLSYKIVSVPTDYETEGLWPHQETDLFCVATESMIDTLLSRNVPRHKIVLTGLPVNPAFLKNYNKRTTKQKFGLPQNKKIAVIMAGASESRPYVNMRRALDHVIKYFVDMDWMHFVFCTGNDSDYKKKLEAECKKYNAKNISVLDYTEDMAQLMNASVIALCKSGGMTVAECISSRLPMLLIGRGYAQEHINTRYLTGMGAAYHADTYKEIIELLCHITSTDTVYSALKVNIEHLRHKNAAYDIVKNSLKLKVSDDSDKPKSLLGIYIGKKPIHRR